MLFYAALFLLLHGNTAWSEVREVKVYEQTSGQNWSQHDQREPELVLSDWARSQSSSFLCLYLLLTYCSVSQAVPGPAGLQFLCHQSRSDSGSLPCHEHGRFTTSPLLPSLCLLPFNTISLFLLRSSFIGLLQSCSNTFFYFSTLFFFFWLNFRFQCLAHVLV